MGLLFPRDERWARPRRADGELKAIAPRNERARKLSSSVRGNGSYVLHVVSRCLFAPAAQRERCGGPDCPRGTRLKASRFRRPRVSRKQGVAPHACTRAAAVRRRGGAVLLDALRHKVDCRFRLLVVPPPSLTRPPALARVPGAQRDLKERAVASRTRSASALQAVGRRGPGEGGGSSAEGGAREPRPMRPPCRSGRGRRRERESPAGRAMRRDRTEARRPPARETPRSRRAERGVNERPRQRTGSRAARIRLGDGSPCRLQGSGTSGKKMPSAVQEATKTRRRRRHGEGQLCCDGLTCKEGVRTC
jgi:hypothetical protein